MPADARTGAPLARLRLGVVGCGVVAAQYAKTIKWYGNLELAGATDLDYERAREFTAAFGGRPYALLDELLADASIDVVVNLTVPRAHAAVTSAALEAGKHVHSEKPFALDYEDATALVELAEQRGVRLSAAPTTLLGEAQQTAWRLVREGRIGTVRLAYAELNWDRIEVWHPVPQPFYEVGVLFDLGVYPLTILTAMFGPARRVWGLGKVLLPERTTLGGERFRVGTPDFVLAAIELAGGMLVRLTGNYYAGTRTKQSGIELHGDLGSVHLRSWAAPGTAVELSVRREPYEPVPLPNEAPLETDYGRGLADLANAIAEGRPHRTTGAHAAHVIEIVCALYESIDRGEPVEVRSEFEPPAPLEPALDRADT